MTAYAEVIGDPVAHSRSPALHRAWLTARGIDADYRATRVTPDGLAAHLAARRADSDWRGCNVTAPLKEAVLPYLACLSPEAEAIGAVNCVVPEPGGLAGFNTDVDGIAEALGDGDLAGRAAALIGAGGAARALVVHLAARGAGPIRVVARDSTRAAALGDLAPVTAFGFDRAADAFAGAALVANASPLGMDGAPPLPQAILAALADTAADATIFDMVYSPPETALLRAAAARGRATATGLAMLEGQARRAFRVFFDPPTGD